MSVSQQIIFIDSQVSDYQSIIAGLSADAIDYCIDSSSDGLQRLP
jgi:hypothetical protein